MFSISWTILPALVHPAFLMEVLWNAPSQVCHKKFNIHLNLSHVGIQHNLRESFTPQAVGDKIVIFYENHLGLYPYFDGGGNPINGGIPQNVNLTQHLTKVEQDITGRIPHVNFDGLAVIDWESWRFTYDTNWGRTKRPYRTTSIQHASQQAMGVLDQTLLRAKAKELFDGAAKNLVLATLRKAKRIRPNAKWGFYGYPECYWHKNDSCSPVTRRTSAELAWLYSEVTGLFPSIYITPKTSSLTSKQRTAMIAERLLEAFHVKKDRVVPIYAYTKISYDTYAENLNFYTMEDLCYGYALPASFGIAGIIIWSSSSSFGNEGKCKAHKGFLHGSFKPYISTVLDRSKQCPSRQCSTNPQGCKFRVICEPNVTKYILKRGCKSKIGPDRFPFPDPLLENARAEIKPLVHKSDDVNEVLGPATDEEGPFIPHLVGDTSSPQQTPPAAASLPITGTHDHSTDKISPTMASPPPDGHVKDGNREETGIRVTIPMDTSFSMAGSGSTGANSLPLLPLIVIVVWMLCKSLIP